MKDLRGQQTGGTYTASNFNHSDDLFNAVESMGQTLDENNPNQVFQGTESTYVRKDNLAGHTNDKGANLVGFFDPAEAPNNTTVNDILLKILTMASETFNVNYMEKAHPVGSFFFVDNATVTPPFYGEYDINWALQNNADGCFLMGASTTGELPVSGGQQAGNSQKTDPMTIANLIAHPHKYFPSASLVGLKSGGGPDAFAQNGGQTPHALPQTEEAGSASPAGIGLSNIKRYGVYVWLRMPPAQNQVSINKKLYAELLKKQEVK